MSGWSFWEKPFVSQNFLLSWIFSDTGRKISKLCPTLFFGRAIEKATYASRGSLWRKTKGFKCFKERCFFMIVYGLWSEKFAFSEKNNSLGSKNSILCVQRNVLGENQNLCIKKLFFFRKILSGIEAKYFGLLGKLFPARLSSFRSTSAEEGFREKFLEKSFFFHCFQTWSKKSTIERTSRWMWKLYSTCLVEFSEEKHSFQSYMIYFFMFFERRIVNFIKKISAEF